MVSQSTTRPLRLWPGVVIVIVQWLGWSVVPRIAPDAGMVALAIAMAGGPAVVIWWLFFSRARWSERVGVLLFMAAAVTATWFMLDKSIRGGMMGLMFLLFPIPGLSLALVAGAAAGRRLSSKVRFAVMAAAIVIGSGVWTTLRTDGIYGGSAQLKWRWTPTAEERLLARAPEEPAAIPTTIPAPPPTPAEAKPAAISAAPATMSKPPVWPGFRGPGRDGVVRGVSIETDWSKSPPVVLWRRPIGPGWSSFAVDGDLVYTQEQRGDQELVSCYRMSTGKPVWIHRDATRFWESNGGPGPRGTPTLRNGRAYTFGATGILNALDARSGAVVWSRNAASDTQTKVPMWGFASSPLVLDDDVIVAVSGTLAAYDLASGKPRWVGPHHGTGSYSSPQLVTIHEVPQILLLSAPGAVSVAPADGKLLWEHTWDGSAIVQPAMTDDGDVLINAIAATGGQGIRRLSIDHTAGGWSVKERWTSLGLKPYLNDFVVHKGHAYGFDGNILSCIDLSDGARKWKGGRFGNGQLVLLADQDLLLILSEDGEIALASATPDHFTELARIPALNAKTWNHPVLAGHTLLIRNGEEMAALKLSVGSR